jgi:C-terminal binding protein
VVGAAELALLPRDAVVVNTARGPILDLDALEEALALRPRRRGGAGRAAGGAAGSRAGADCGLPGAGGLLMGRLVILPHVAFHSPEAWDDIRLKSAETMRDVLLRGLRTNVIPPEADCSAD